VGRAVRSQRSARTGAEEISRNVAGVTGPRGV
jgi:hypothetical protein